MSTKCPVCNGELVSGQMCIDRHHLHFIETEIYVNELQKENAALKKILLAVRDLEKARMDEVMGESSASSGTTFDTHMKLLDSLEEYDRDYSDFCEYCGDEYDSNVG